jgi:predicted AAA+ superfamily ATPase
MQTIAGLKRIKLSLSGLIYFEDLLGDKKISACCSLLDALTAPVPDCAGIYRQYQSFYKSMLGTNWVKYLVETLFKSQNEFTLLAASRRAIDPLIQDSVSGDLRIIQEFAQITPQDILVLVKQRFQQEMTAEEKDIFVRNLSPEKWPVWEAGIPEEQAEPELASCSATQWLQAVRTLYFQRFVAEKSWENNVSLLIEYYQNVGCGIFAKYAAFNVQESGQGLEGIENTDPIRISNLICQEREQAIVLRNTEGFLQGYPANNIILYGNRGTGKSSLVKALLNEYADRGLRLVQLRKNKIGAFPKLAGELAKVPLKFIIFIDDLSFTDEEEDYKNLKSLLEGGVESRPANVLVYATSNRKHLVRETFADRKGDEIHAHDNMEEKLSLADRFGITVTFLSPDQETFLKIVEGLAFQNNIPVDKDELRKKALKWVMMHNGRSGRTARQFIDHLTAELGISGK